MGLEDTGSCSMGLEDTGKCAMGLEDTGSCAMGLEDTGKCAMGLEDTEGGWVGNFLQGLGEASKSFRVGSFLGSNSSFLGTFSGVRTSCWLLLHHCR